MLLEGKNAVVYGGGGSMGGAVARAYGREGARVFLAGRTQAKLDEVAGDIVAAGGAATTAQVDAHDSEAIEGHLDAVVKEGGGVDVSLNAVGMDAVQDVPLAEMTLDDFMTPITEAARTQFLTATAAARRMQAQESGVIVMLSSSAARESGYRMGGFSIACAAIECLTRSLAGEVGEHGVRVVALRPNFTPETVPEIAESHPDTLRPLIDGTALGRLPRLREVGASAAFVASDGAGAITGAVVNLTCGAIVD
ncbi:MAG: SDR family NAD(P)-dependent oxidoreductase [Solirubrobacterales bacterium]